MTINAPAAWLLSLYIATAEKQGVDRKLLSGTTQNDISKECHSHAYSYDIIAQRTDMFCR